jgi:hypothetical protein
MLFKSSTFAGSASPTDLMQWWHNRRLVCYLLLCSRNDSCILENTVIGVMFTFCVLLSVWSNSQAARLLFPAVFNVCFCLANVWSWGIVILIIWKYVFRCLQNIFSIAVNMHLYSEKSDHQHIQTLLIWVLMDIRVSTVNNASVRELSDKFWGGTVGDHNIACVLNTGAVIAGSCRCIVTGHTAGRCSFLFLHVHNEKCT